MPTLANLRSRRNKAVNFTPSKAYWISGHGAEPNDGRTFTVPPGCIIVVKVTPGELSYVFLDYEKQLSSMDKDKLKDPLKNTNYLIDNFGSIVIFKPGDQCPVFYYELVACFPSGDYKKCNTFGSGIIDIDTIISNQAELLNIPEDADISSYIANLYEKSIYPTKQQIQEALAKLTLPLEENSWKSYTHIQKMHWILDKIKKLWEVDQSSICNNLGTGVYYNFICRYRGKETNDVYNYSSGVNNSHGRHHSAVRGIANIRGKNKLKNRLLILNRIAEAETRRKRLLANYYTSNEFKQKQSSKEQNKEPINKGRQYSIAKAISARNMPVKKNWLEEKREEKNENEFVKHKFVPSIFKINDGMEPRDLYSYISKAYSSNTYQINQIIEIIDKLASTKNRIFANEIINYTEDLTNSEYGMTSIDRGKTPLWQAIDRGLTELILPLLKAGADTSIIINGKTIFDISYSPKIRPILEKYAGKSPNEIRTMINTEKAEAERQKAEDEKQKAEAEKQKVEAEKQKIEAEKQKAEAEKQRYGSDPHLALVRKLFELQQRNDTYPDLNWNDHQLVYGDNSDKTLKFRISMHEKKHGPLLMVTPPQALVEAPIANPGGPATGGRRSRRNRRNNKRNTRRNL